LHVGHFQPVGIEIDRHLDDVRELMQVLAMHHRIHRQRQVELAGPFRDPRSSCDGESFRPATRSAMMGFIALEADLDVAQPGIG